MAKKVYLYGATTVQDAIPQDGYKDARGISLNFTPADLLTSTTIEANGERRFGIGATPAAAIPMGFWSERLAAEYTISGNITFNLWAWTSGTFAGRLRVRLSKITVGGSNIESPIVEGDASADLTASIVVYNFALTPSQSVTVAPNERLILRVSVVNPVGTGHGVLRWGRSAGTGLCWFEFTENLTFRLNETKLWFRDTTANGIGNFYDMLATRGSGATTGVVNTVGGGTEIQWTRTAGGTVLEWISGRLIYPWSVTTVAVLSTWCTCWAHESAAGANARWLVKLFRRRPSGAETLVISDDNTHVELTTTSGQQVAVAAETVLNAATTFEEDDRIVIRCYITNIGTMGGSQTCTLTYNHTTTGSGDSFILLTDLPEGSLKAETDPDRQAPPSGMATMGMGT